MKRLILAAAGLLLATANTPPSTSASVAPGGELDSVVAAEAPKAPKADSPAAKADKPKPPRIAAAPAKEGGNGYPRCSSSVQDRCAQGRSANARSGHGAHQERRMQLAMRAGERG
jgi:hypothetical protein